VDDYFIFLCPKSNNINSEETQKLIDDLMHTCNKAKGMGIAAPQVFHSKQIFIMSSHPNERYPNAPVMEPVAVINPKITWQSEEQESGWEGCLSVPGLRGLVPRSTSIKVAYTNRYDEEIEATYNGFLARVFLHEYNHLTGTLFIDKVLSESDIITEQEFQKMMSH